MKERVLDAKATELASTAPTDPDGPTGQLAQWLAAVELIDIPGEVIERARYLMLDGIGCALVGAQLPWSRTAVGIVADFDGGQDCTIIGWGRRTTASAAALLNGTFIQGFELDDFHPFAPLHSASIVLPSLFACAEKQVSRPVSGEEFLLAMLCGLEVGPRVGLALHGAQMLSRGWHSGSVFGTHASAAAAGKLMGLGAAAFEDALGLAGTQSAGLMAAQFEAMSKRMHHGFASRNGLYAAVLAAGGYTGIKRVFERDYGGFLSTFGEGHAPDASQVSGELGTRWETQRIIIKRHAAMGGLLAAIDGIQALKRETGFTGDDIERIEIDLGHAVFHHGGWVAERPLTSIGAQMNMAYAVAVTVLDGVALTKQFVAPRLDADDVWDLIGKITVRHDATFDTLGPAARGATRLVVHFRNRPRRELLLRYPEGKALPEVSNEEIVHKFRQLTDGVIAVSRRDEIERAVVGLDKMADVRELIGLLAEPVKSPLE
jgi:aconitate decarboxylase